ncbi:hypothetical protein [Klebsiella oxytoca]|uniref:hypothetical protein n=1 Tax=Klebsiella oxytoca TaxID=571 RepID=UPI0019186FB3|nr:hypothetical protein [Klebsiella oxytoca]HAT1590647.1 hypothetical protein [Klebsiella oxytoca]HCD7233909.1 hypothetical protein [Klebsiella oxytoca]
MAMKRYGADFTDLTVNGLPIDEFGDSDPPFTVEDIDPRSTLKRGVGKTSVRLDSQTRPKRLTVNLMPGSYQVRQLLALEKSGVDFFCTYRQRGTDETIAAFDGVITNRGPMGRAGKRTVTDEQFIFEFTDSEET